MQTNINIHPKYAHLRNGIEEIAKGNYTFTHTFCNKRNSVGVSEISGNIFVIKRYGVPNKFNRLIYTFFRKSKARRAYENALLILRHGISTPFPVAYIETKKRGIFHTGYLITEYVAKPTLNEWKKIESGSEENEKIKRDFIGFTIDLHEKGILPLDYNSKNIFCYKEGNSGEYKFALTDINRVRFGNKSRYKGPMYSFEQLGLSANHLFQVIVDYASLRNLDLEASLFLVLYYRMKNRIKKFLKGEIKNCFS